MLDPWTLGIGAALFGGSSGPSRIQRVRARQERRMEAGKGPAKTGNPVMDMVNRQLFMRRGSPQYRRELRQIQTTLRDPSVARFLSPAGREALFGDMADQFDSTYGQARLAGLGGLALSGLSDSGARAALENRWAATRSAGLASAVNQATMQHAQASYGIYQGLFQPLWSRELGRWQTTQQAQLQKELGRLSLLGGVGSAAGSFAGMGLGYRMFGGGGTSGG